jgi:predicted PurR-regulated permease PerM
MGALFGFVGVLPAIPLVVALQVLLHELGVKRMDERGTDSNPPKKRTLRLRRGSASCGES